MRKLHIIIYLTFLSSLVCSQDAESSLYENRLHYSFDKGKWTGSGTIYYSEDSTVIFRSEAGYGEVLNVFYLSREWFYPNGNIERKVFIDFRKPNKARLIDKEYSENGKLTNSIRKKAKRNPEQNSYDKVDW